MFAHATAPTVKSPSWRRRPVGTELGPDGRAHFRVWAPRRNRVDVELSGDPVRHVTLEREGNGYFSGFVDDAHAGTLYRYRLDGDGSFPDPVSRFQPEGPHGPSELITPDFPWTDAHWRGSAQRAPVLYEMHIGTFTAEGTWSAAMAELPALAELGITMLEIMPVNEFSGRFGWGYDGVDLFAPFHHYGRPDDFRRFVDRAHALGIAVILDVVYNHFGPDGNYLAQYSATYVAEHHYTDWGAAVNFDSDGCQGTREFVLSNAAYWIDEYHLDGLRLDATQNIYDDSPIHILDDIGAAARRAARGRPIYIVVENESQDVKLLWPEDEAGYALDAAWNDDWHHSATVALGGRNEAYYADYRGSAGEFIAAAKYGYLYQGQWYRWQKKRRGVAGLDLRPTQFVHFLENHDQVANTFDGERLCQVACPRRIRALTTLLLLGPQTPMLFQGQEFGATNPFLYFADHGADLMKLVREGRGKFMMQFQSIAARGAGGMHNPCDEQAFMRSKLDHAERTRHHAIHALHRDLIALRQHDPVFSAPRRGGVDGAVLRDDAFLLRFFGVDGDDRLLLINLGAPLEFTIMPEPLLAPTTRGTWSVLWTSEDTRYGGLGLPVLSAEMNDWTIPGDCAVVLAPGDAAP